jgi:hypothetical protein
MAAVGPYPATVQMFKLPTNDQWNGSKDSYVANALTDATDEKLLELASHLDIESTP